MVENVFISKSLADVVLCIGVVDLIVVVVKVEVDVTGVFLNKSAFLLVVASLAEGVKPNTPFFNFLNAVNGFFLTFLIIFFLGIFGLLSFGRLEDLTFEDSNAENGVLGSGVCCFGCLNVLTKLGDRTVGTMGEGDMVVLKIVETSFLKLGKGPS